MIELSQLTERLVQSALSLWSDTRLTTRRSVTAVSTFLEMVEIHESCLNRGSARNPSALRVDDDHASDMERAHALTLLLRRCVYNRVHQHY